MPGRNRLLAVAVLASLIASAGYLVYTRGSQGELPPVFDQDLDNHPLYKTYDLGEDARVLDIGTQPLLFPTGLITEVLKRDQIFRESLANIGIEVRFHPFLKGRDVNHFLKEGRVDAGIGGDAPTLSAIASMNVIAPVVMQRGFLSIVADHPMLVEDLKGKDIGYARGSNAHYALLAALQSRDLDPDDVNLIPMDITQMTAALEQGIVDAFSAWGPEPAEAINTHPDFVTIHQHIGTGFMYFAHSVEETHPDIMPHTVAAIARAVTWLRESDNNLYQAADWFRHIYENLSGRPLSLSNRQIAALAEKELIGLFTLPELPKSDLKTGGHLQQEFEFLVKIGKISSEVPWEEVRAGFREDIFATVLESPVVFRLDEYSYDLN